MNPLIRHLLLTRAPLTVEAFISLNFCFEGYTTIAELEEHELCEDVAQIAGMVESGELRDVKGELKNA